MSENEPQTTFKSFLVVQSNLKKGWVGLDGNLCVGRSIKHCFAVLIRILPTHNMVLINLTAKLNVHVKGCQVLILQYRGVCGAKRHTREAEPIVVCCRYYNASQSHVSHRVKKFDSITCSSLMHEISCILSHVLRRLQIVFGPLVILFPPKLPNRKARSSVKKSVFLCPRGPLVVPLSVCPR